MCGVLRRYKKYMMLTWLESKVLYTLYWPHSLKHSVKLPGDPWCLGDDPASFWDTAYFQGRTARFREVTRTNFKAN